MKHFSAYCLFKEVSTKFQVKITPTNMWSKGFFFQKIEAVVDALRETVFILLVREQNLT